MTDNKHLLDIFMELYDIGGTWIRGAFVMHSGDKLVFLEKRKERAGQDFCSQVKKMSPKLRKASTPHCVSVAVAGPVQDKVALKVPPLGIMDKIDIGQELRSLDSPVYVSNDLNAAVYAELAIGYGRIYENFYLLTFSTGIGAGIVLGGLPMPKMSGEFGHNVLGNNYDYKCGCGNYGCWGAMCSGKGIENLVEKHLGKKMAAEEFFAYGDKQKTSGILEIIRDYNAKGIGMMLNASNVDAIIVMGSIGLNQFEKIIPDPEDIERYTINPVPPIIRTRLGNNIGLLGAYYSALPHLKIAESI